MAAGQVPGEPDFSHGEFTEWTTKEVNLPGFHSFGSTYLPDTLDSTSRVVPHRP